MPANLWGWLRSWRAERQWRWRRDQWRGLASALGLALMEDTDSFFIPVHWYGLGDQRVPARHVVHVVCGVYRGRHVSCFDDRLRFVGRDATVHERTMVAVARPCAVPQIKVRPRRSEAGLSSSYLASRKEAHRRYVEHYGAGREVLGLGSEEFDRRYFVECDDSVFARNLLHERAMEHVLANWPLAIVGGGSLLPAVGPDKADPQHPLLKVQRGGSPLLFHLQDHGLLPIPVGVRALLDVTCEFMDLVPQYMSDNSGRQPVSG